MPGLEVLSAHHERAVLAVDDLILKVDTDAGRTDVEVEAMRLAVGVPSPRLLWRKPPVLALERLRGTPLAQLGAPLTTPPSAWSSAGAVVRSLHGLALPPWPGWRVPDFAAYLDGACRWLVDEQVVESAVVERVRLVTEAALRPFPLVFTHGDFQPAHVFVDGEEVVGVIDWADACQGDALFDIAVLTVGFEEQLGDVLRGYGDEGADRDVIRGWWAFRRLTSVRWMVEHGLDATGDIAALRTTS